MLPEPDYTWTIEWLVADSGLLSLMMSSHQCFCRLIPLGRTLQWRILVSALGTRTSASFTSTCIHPSQVSVITSSYGYYTTTSAPPPAIQHYTAPPSDHQNITPTYHNMTTPLYHRNIASPPHCHTIVPPHFHTTSLYYTVAYYIPTPLHQHTAAL